MHKVLAIALSTALLALATPVYAEGGIGHTLMQTSTVTATSDMTVTTFSEFAAQEAPEIEAYDYDESIDSPIQNISIDFSTVWTAVRSAFTTYKIGQDALPYIISFLVVITALGFLTRFLVGPPEV